MGVKFVSSEHRGAHRRGALSLAAGVAWSMPGCFSITQLLGPSYSLRCVVFHNISDTESPFTEGMGVSMAPTHFEAALRFLVRHYIPVGLQDVIDGCNGRGLPQRAVLVTFDDGYASVMESAAPLCHKLGVPAIFFLNAAFIDNRRLGPDNLVCYAANVLGMETINAAVRCVEGSHRPALQSMADVFARFFPAISLTRRQSFLEALLHLGGIDERQMAEEAGLYMTSEQLCGLAASDFEVGNHTYTHVRCRNLSAPDFGQEIDRNKAELEALSGKKVRAFSIPYGSSGDLSADLVEHLRCSGHELVFLSESVANPHEADPFRLDRVGFRTNREDGFFFEIEVLPRLRAIRNQVLRFRHEGSRRRDETSGARSSLSE